MVYLHALKMWWRASFIQRTAPKTKNKEETKNKNRVVEKKLSGDSQSRQSRGQKSNYESRIAKTGSFYVGVKEVIVLLLLIA